MKYSRIIQISAAGSRRAANWPLQRMNLEEFCSRLRTPFRSTETLEAYLRMPKAKQDELKDVGGYVFGALKGGKRRAGHVEARDGIVLDADNIPPGGTEDLLHFRLGVSFYARGNFFNSLHVAVTAFPCC